MFKKTKSVRTSLPQLKGHQPMQLTNDDLRRTGGAVMALTSGQSTLNCDDWCDCD